MYYTLLRCYLLSFCLVEPGFEFSKCLRCLWQLINYPKEPHVVFYMVQTHLSWDAQLNVLLFQCGCVTQASKMFLCTHGECID